MVIVSLLGFAIALVLIGIGIVLGLVAVAATVALVGAGMVSSSVMIGLWRGKARTGLRAFLLQAGILGGIPAGMFCAWVGNAIWHQVDGTVVAILVVGGAAGAVAGLILALMFDFIAERLHGWLGERLEAGKAKAIAWKR